MRILQINSVFGFGSTGRICKDIAAFAESNGHEAMVAYGRGDTHHGQLRISGTLGLLSHVAVTRLFDRHGLGSRMATSRLTRHIRQYQPDIVHIHNIHGYYLNYPLLLAYLAECGTPVVLTMHDCWTFTGHCSHFDFIGCDRWLTECRACPQKREYPESLWLDRSRANFWAKKVALGGLPNLTIVTPSNWLRDKVAQSFLGGRDCRVIHNGVDTAIFRPDGPDRRDEYPWLKPGMVVVLAVASIWTPRKGLDYLLRAMSDLPENFHLLVVGALRTGLPESVRLHHISRTSNIHELAGLYRLADLMVNPTLEDTFPTTNLEALACGTPVVTFRTGGSPESVGPGCGMVVERGDVQNLVAAMVEVHRTGKKRYSDSCVSRVRDHYVKETKYGEYLQLYQEISQKYKFS